MTRNACLWGSFWECSRIWYSAIRKVMAGYATVTFYSRPDRSELRRKIWMGGHGGHRSSRISPPARIRWELLFDIRVFLFTLAINPMLNRPNSHSISYDVIDE